MRLKDLTKNISDMSDEALRSHVQNIRNTKYKEKPAQKKIIADAHKKEVRQHVNKAAKLLDKMSDADKQQLLLLLEEQENGGQS